MCLGKVKFKPFLEEKDFSVSKMSLTGFLVKIIQNGKASWLILGAKTREMLAAGHCPPRPGPGLAPVPVHGELQGGARG